MRQADALTKEYLSNNEIFADVFNYLIYDGQQRILPENLIERDTSEITLPLGKRGELATIQKFRDILKGCIAKEYKNTLYVLFGVENQSHIHYAMPVRNMLYDAINYSAQVNEKTKKYRKIRKQNPNFKETTEEFLSGFRKEDKLMPVVTLVIYFGDKSWDGAKSVHDMFCVDDEQILKYVPDYKINLIEPIKVSDNEYEKFKTDLGSVLQFIKHQSDDDGRWIKGKRRFQNVEKEAVELINMITGANIAGKEKDEVVDVCRAWENSLKNAKDEGQREGRIAGQIEAYIDCNMTIPEIAKKVSKPEEYVREVVKKLSAVSQ